MDQKLMCRENEVNDELQLARKATIDNCSNNQQDQEILKMILNDWK